MARETAAGTPFTLAGELFWNFGVIGVVVGMALAGAMAGLGMAGPGNQGERHHRRRGPASRDRRLLGTCSFTRPLGRDAADTSPWPWQGSAWPPSAPAY